MHFLTGSKLSESEKRLKVNSIDLESRELNKICRLCSCRQSSDADVTPRLSLYSFPRLTTPELVDMMQGHQSSADIHLLLNLLKKAENVRIWTAHMAPVRRLGGVS